VSPTAATRLANIAATAVLQAASFLIGIWVARTVGVAEFGTLQMLRLVVDYGAFLTVGVPQAVSFELPLALGKAEESEAATAIGVLVWTCLFVAGASLLGFASVEALSLPLNGLYGRGQWIVSGLVLALTTLTMVPQVVLVSRESFGRLAVARSCYVVALTAGALLAVPSWGIIGFLGAMAGGAACELSYWLFTSKGAISFHWSLSHWRRYVSYGSSIQARSTLRLFLTSVDLWIVSALLGSGAAGVYAFATLLIRGYQFLPGMLYETAFPRVAKEFARADRELGRIRGYLVEYLAAAVPVFVASAAANLAVFWVVIDHWMPNYAGAKLPFAVLLVGAYCSSTATMFASVLIMARRHRQVALLEAAAFALAGTLGVVAVAFVRTLWIAATVTTVCLAAEAVVVLTIAVQAAGWGPDIARFVRSSLGGMVALVASVLSMAACEHLAPGWPGDVISLVVVGSIAVVFGLTGLARIKTFWSKQPAKLS
jgi:O-antigen/teichoic acid export membrane protein